MAPDKKTEGLQVQGNLPDALDGWKRELRRRRAFLYLARMDMLPPSYRRKVGRYGNWLGFALFLPLGLFVLWKVCTG